MRPEKVAYQDIMTGFLSVFRSKGFAGASLPDLAEASVLKKASLYHRFPGGKAEMASAVLAFVGAWGEEHLFSILRDPRLAVGERVERAIVNIDTLYQGGQANCILRALSTGDGIEFLGQKIEGRMQEWLNAFTQLGLDLGWSAGQSKAEALLTLTDLQGSLVVARGLDDPEVFANFLQRLQDRYSTVLVQKNQ